MSDEKVVINGLREIAEYSLAAKGKKNGKPLVGVRFSSGTRRVLRQGESLEQLRKLSKKKRSNKAAILGAIKAIETLAKESVTSVVPGGISPRYLRDKTKEFKERMRDARRGVKYSSRYNLDPVIED